MKAVFVSLCVCVLFPYWDIKRLVLDVLVLLLPYFPSGCLKMCYGLSDVCCLRFLSGGD